MIFQSDVLIVFNLILFELICLATITANYIFQIEI